MSSEKMRQEFEAWHRSVVVGDPPHDKYNGGDYRNVHVQRYWAGWQASREALVIDLSTATKTTALPNREWILHEDVVAAIEAASVKVK